MQSMRVCSLCSTKIARRVSTLSGDVSKWSRQVQLASERRRAAEGKQRQRGGGYRAVSGDFSTNQSRRNAQDRDAAARAQCGNRTVRCARICF